MKHKFLISHHISELCDSTDMTMGEIIYSIFRRKHFPSKPDDVKTGWLLNIKDEDLYNSIQGLINEENKNDE